MKNFFLKHMVKLRPKENKKNIYSPYTEYKKILQTASTLSSDVYVEDAENDDENVDEEEEKKLGLTAETVKEFQTIYKTKLYEKDGASQITKKDAETVKKMKKNGSGNKIKLEYIRLNVVKLFDLMEKEKSKLDNFLRRFWEGITYSNFEYFKLSNLSGLNSCENI